MGDTVSVATRSAEQQFKVDAADHILTIRHDSPGHRHLVMSAPGSGEFWFEIVTWQGVLAYSGDMGDFMFRVYDPATTDLLTQLRWTDPGYLGGKVVAGRVKEYNRHEAVSWLNEALAAEISGDPDIEEHVVAFRDDLEDAAHRGEEDLREVIEEFHNDVGWTVLGDQCDIDLAWHTYHFRWAVAAINHTKALYLASKEIR